jgi:hypothetical protein
MINYKQLTVRKMKKVFKVFAGCSVHAASGLKASVHACRCMIERMLSEGRGCPVWKGTEFGKEEGVSKVHFRKFYLIHSCCDKGEIDEFRLLRHPLVLFV